MRATAAIILAAGGASRFGSAKQLALYDGIPLVRHAVAAAEAAGCAPVIVVAGEKLPEIAAVLKGTVAQVVENARWRAGMGASLHCGLAALDEWEAVLIMASDQPLVTELTLRRLMAAGKRAPEATIAAAYAGTSGIPVLFPSCQRSLLEAVPEGQGAKAVLAAHADVVTTVPAPEAGFDIDYPEDLGRMISAIPA